MWRVDDIVENLVTGSGDPGEPCDSQISKSKPSWSGNDLLGRRARAPLRRDADLSGRLPLVRDTLVMRASYRGILASAEIAQLQIEMARDYRVSRRSAVAGRATPLQELTVDGSDVVR